MSGYSSTNSSTTTLVNSPSETKLYAMSIRNYATEKQRTPEVKRVGIESYKQVALSLANAFAKDELAFYFMNTEDNWRTKEQVWDLHVEILEYIVAAHCYNGEVHTIGDNHEGVALWMPPGCNMDDYYTMFRSGMWRLWYKLTPEGRKRYFDEFFTVLHDTKAEVLGDRDANSWYLVYLGVDPVAQKRGYARKLLEHVLKRADKEGLPTYLESSNIVNVPIYEKFGFVVKKNITMNRAEKPVPLDIMVREPRMPQLKSTKTVTTRPRQNSTKQLAYSPVASAFVRRQSQSIASNLRPVRIAFENA